MGYRVEELKVEQILTDGGTAEPDYSGCRTLADVMDSACDALDSSYDHVASVFVKCQDGWHYGELRFEVEPVPESSVPDPSEFAFDIRPGRREDLLPPGESIHNGEGI